MIKKIFQGFSWLSLVSFVLPYLYVLVSIVKLNTFKLYPNDPLKLGCNLFYQTALNFYLIGFLSLLLNIVVFIVILFKNI